MDKQSPEYQEALWRKWPRTEDWPGHLNLYEAAAYKRIGYLTLWRACQCTKDGHATLAHQRFGSVYRVSKTVLDGFGLVPAKETAA